MTSEPVASSRERLPGVLLGPSRSGKCKARSRSRPLGWRCALHKAGAGAGGQGGDAHCPLRGRRCLGLNPKGLLMCVEVCTFDFQSMCDPEPCCIRVQQVACWSLAEYPRHEQYSGPQRLVVKHLLR